MIRATIDIDTQNTEGLTDALVMSAEYYGPVKHISLVEMVPEQMTLAGSTNSLTYRKQM